MSKKVNFFIDAYGKEGGEIQTIVLTDKMLPPEIESSFRKVAMANANDNLQLILSQQNQQKQQKHIPFEYDELSVQVEYRLVVTRLRAEETPKFVFSSNATSFHDNDEFAKSCLELSITLAERLMATDSYARQLQVLNKDTHKFSEMLSTTQVFYYNFNRYQEEEANERKTYNQSTEGNGNGLSLEVMQTAAKIVEEWSKKNWIDERINDFKEELKEKLEKEVKEKNLRCTSRQVDAKLEQVSSDEEEKWRQKAENEWNEKRERENENKEGEHSNEKKRQKRLDDDTPLAWTKHRTGNHSKIIYMNELFLKRLKIIKEEYTKEEEYVKFNIEHDHECRVIIVAQAFAIIHETAHLSLRWRGLLNTPCCIPNQTEAGEYLESSFFNFLFSLLVERVIDDIEYPWDESQTIKGIGVINCGDKSRVVRNVREDYIKRVCRTIIGRNDLKFRNALLDDSTFYPIECTKGSHAFGKKVAVTKGKDDYQYDNTSDSFYESDKIRPVRTCGLSLY